MHDKLYDLGFTEAAGNFQYTNFGRGGVEGDPVVADAQYGRFPVGVPPLPPDPPQTNNALFVAASDGAPGWIQMYLWTGPDPDRDGDLDAEVVLHEYTHGVSYRRVGGGVGIGFSGQPGGLGEGWSDFFAMALLSEPDDDINASYPSGGYTTYLLQYGSTNLTENYYYGIRRYPYSTDLNKNPLTYKDIDPGQAQPHTNAPLSPKYSPFDPTIAFESHRAGELWCVTLWDARANIINKMGWTNGNQLVLKAVLDGMNLTPANPTFLHARDAILLADRVNNGGTNATELWQAFTKRGMGYGALSQRLGPL